MYHGRESDYMEYMHMTQNCSSCPVLEQLSRRNQKLLWERIRTFVYGSCGPIFMILVHGEFTWIIHVLSIIGEETHQLQNILKTFHCTFFSKWMMSIDLFTEISSHLCGSNKIIEGSRSQAHINHNIAYSCRCSCIGDISIKVKWWVLIIEDGLWFRNIKA